MSGFSKTELKTLLNQAIQPHFRRLEKRCNVTTSSATTGVVNILSTGTLGPYTYAVGLDIREIEVIIKDTIDLTVVYTKSDGSTVTRTLAGPGTYVLSSELNEAPFTQVDITNLTAAAGDLIVNALSKK